MADSTESKLNPPLRVIHWGMARSLSTVFEKCMSFVDGVQIINEPYNGATFIGPEGILLGAKHKDNETAKYFEETGLIDKLQTEANTLSGYNLWDDNLCTFQWVKDTLEGVFPEKTYVFVKDLITGIHGKYEYLPQGFIHTFMIRNPLKVAISKRKVFAKMLPPGTPEDQLNLTGFPMWKMLPAFGFGELLQLINHLQEIGEIKGNPIVIDADDLQNHPESVLKQYCERVGIPFNKDLLTWEAGDACVKRNWMASKMVMEGNQLMEYFSAAFASTGFLAATDTPPVSSLTKDVIEFAETAEPFYKKLFEMRIKP